MLKKILKLILELALIAFVIYGILSLVNSFSVADEHETAPWCVTEYRQVR